MKRIPSRLAAAFSDTKPTSHTQPGTCGTSGFRATVEEEIEQGGNQNVVEEDEPAGEKARGLMQPALDVRVHRPRQRKGL
ncbi:MAG TPA: hypothetical protein VFW10_05645 [Steroidobacteraceae bacterium]|nr:hypothetical protein [Steroidobacteraceae bacterium]